MAENTQGNVKPVFYSLEFVNGIRRVIYFSLIVLYFISLGHNIVKVTAMFAVSRLLLAFSEFPTGAFADYYSRKSSIIISFLLMGVGFLGFYAFSNFWLLTIAYILGDIGWTFQSGTTIAWAVDELKYGKNQLKITKLLNWFYFFEKVGAIIGGVIAYFIVSFEFRLIWLAVALLNILTGIALIRFMPEKRKSSLKKNNTGIFRGVIIQTRDSIKFILDKKNRQVRGLAFASIFAVICIDAFYIELPLILSQKIGLTPDSISMIIGLIGILVLSAPFIGTAIVQKSGFSKSFFIMFFGVAASIIVFALSNSLVLTIITMCFFYMLEKITEVLHNAALQHRLSSKNRASLGSAMNALWFVSNALAAGFLSICLSLTSLTTATILTGVVGVFAGIAYFMALRE